MEIRKIVETVVGLILVIGGAYFTFKPKLNYQKESTSDLFAIMGIILMIVGVVLLFSPLLR
jgi:membrane-bound ClpP family serine protease